jgi:hypothetical protein
MISLTFSLTRNTPIPLILRTVSNEADNRQFSRFGPGKCSACHADGYGHSTWYSPASRV